MAHDQKARRRTSAAAITLAAVLGTLLAAVALAPSDDAGASATSGGSSCSGAAQEASDASRQELRRTVRCLFNEQRTLRDLVALDRDLSLQKAAQRHSKVMGATDCLAHRCPREAGLEERVRKAGYMAEAKRWRYAENTGCAADAEAMVNGWMQSDYHRINVLDREFIDIGVGVVGDRVKGSCPRGYATFAVVVGWREPAE